MTTIQDKAYKLASTFYLSSCHDDWTGERLRKAILADPDSGDKQALADQQELEVWEPIERHICACCSMDDPNVELDDLIDNLADAFVQFARCADISPHSYERVFLNQSN
jgi:hypothetical protein